MALQQRHERMLSTGAAVVAGLALGAAALHTTGYVWPALLAGTGGGFIGAVAGLGVSRLLGGKGDDEAGQGG